MDYLSLCLICKDENDHLAEWIDYHILLGVDRFYIYDNQSHVSLREPLRDYIAQGWATVVDIQGKARQLYAYEHCLRQFGGQTRWLGFIDTDEFLVPKTTHNLAEFLQAYEPYGALAVSSLFFGSGGHATRPTLGQLASYTLRTPADFYQNQLIKCVVQPQHTWLPFSPHDFIYREGWWCVNENFLRVDYQRFHHFSDKIQLNHYFCRSEEEIEQKLRRGNSGDVTWSRKRFDGVNQNASIPDRTAVNLVENILRQGRGGQDQPGEGPDHAARIARLARARAPRPPAAPASLQPIGCVEIDQLVDISTREKEAEERGDARQMEMFLHEKIRLYPTRASLYTDLAALYLNAGEPQAAWKALTLAWTLAPNSYLTLVGLARYFLHVGNYEMAEKTSRTLLQLTPGNLPGLAYATASLLGLERLEEALRIGEPLILLAGEMGGYIDGMATYMIKKLADFLQQNQQTARAVRLWQASCRCLPGDVEVRLEWIQTLWLDGQQVTARQELAQVLSANPRHPEAIRLQETFRPTPNPKRRRH